MALRDMLERKAASAAASMSEEDAVGAGVAQASLDMSDTMSEGLRLRSEMQRAVQEERCGFCRLCWGMEVFVTCSDKGKA